MYFLEEHLLGYIAHPKTASSATQRVLRDLGADLHGNHHDVDGELCQQILDAGGIIMATVRNPFDLMVSWYFHYKQRRGTTANDMKSFATWLPQQLSNPNQYIKKGLFYGWPWFNRTVRFENLQRDFDRVLVEAGIEPITIEPFNVSRFREGRCYQEMYTPNLVALVHEHFGAELEEHGYSFEEQHD